jgi:reactive intermediate/imine deaminase
VNDRTPIHPTEFAPVAGPYTPGLRAGRLVFVSGQGPFSPDGSVVGEDIAGQARAAFANVLRVVAEAGGSAEHIVRIGAYLNTLDDFAGFNEVMRETFSEPYPARTTVPVDLPGFLIEIDAIAVLPET